MNDATVGIWTWVGTDRYLKYSDWSINEPNPNNNCAVVQTVDFTWKSKSCSENRPFVCSIPIKINLCDDGWTHFKETNSCYKVFYNKNWDAAELVCRAENAHLTSIHDENENNFVVDLAKTGITMDIYNTTWIGLHTSSSNTADVSSYTWTDGSSLDYSKWSEDQPDNDGEACVQLLSDAVTRKPYFVKQWNNLPCNRVLRNFVCKKKSNLIQK
uniref:C-type lectin domain-containing protein n=1 Tax=Panagrolaimus sp. JU765 TaxID=591449 RepID=A0AC34RPB3_9BILA